MSNYSTDYGSVSERAESARGVVSQHLDAVESGVETALDGLVHEFRGKAEELAGAMLDRIDRSWQQQWPRIEAYMDAHPWIVFGGLILLAYIFSGNDRNKHMQNTIYR